MAAKQLVSVCTPVYNGEKFLADCISGVLAQRYDNFEYIIVDNASTDRTPEIIERFRKEDSRIKVFRNPETLFIIDNFMTCASHCSSESTWIKYALADDFLYPNCLEEMIRVAEQSPSVALVSGLQVYGRALRNRGLPVRQSVFPGSEILKRELLRKLHVCSHSPNTLMYRKDAFEAAGGLHRKYLHSDTELAFRLLDGYDFGFAHCALTQTGLHGGRGMNRAESQGIHLREYLDFGFRNLGAYKSVNLSPRELDELAEFYAQHVNEFLARKAARFDTAKIREIWDGCPREVRAKVWKMLRRRPNTVVMALLRELRDGYRD